jgi:mannose/cellobiose epimerase-like protein (N-acyl-D-glucosamine 2-epimerase family)/anti-anti-sigma regulatory factor
MDNMHFTFSDTIAGYVTSSDQTAGTFGLKTTDGREFQIKLTDATYAEMVRNLGEPWQDPGAPMAELLPPGRYLFAYGIFYPENGQYTFEAKHLVFVGRTEHEWRFEAPDWWVQQIRSLAEFYFKAQFPDGNVDFHHYRTHLTLEGQQIDSTRQETDTISRLIYGFASAYMLTGDDRYLEVAEKGTEYLREHMRAVDEKEDIAYWYHAIDVKGKRERKILASEFGDDYEAIPAYEQIYALAGPVQTYRITGDPRILRDAEMTVNLFDKYFLDRNLGGYFSHLDPVTFDPRVESLGHNRARKNWNSVGDHAPAYLINLWLATGDDRYADMLVYTADTIATHFPDYENSPFVNEKFFEDWSHDHNTPLQKNRTIIGHNLKIAWNLMRIHHLRASKRYEEFACKIADIMPRVGMDRQRGGWYDMAERLLGPDEEFHRLIWHDRKAWWQQEQGILAYLILAGSLKNAEYMRLARESAAFYNAWFPDHDSGGVYFNVLACGIPYLLGTERLKGSHSMSGYHSFELCYLAAVYTNLLLTKQPMDFYFKPQPGALPDNVLRVQPDILPPGSIRLEAVWINGERYANFDAEAMTIRLPEQHTAASALHPLQQRPAWAGNPNLLPATTTQELRIKVRIVPAGLSYDMELTMQDGVAELLLEGIFDDSAEVAFMGQLSKVVAAQPKRLILHMADVRTLSKACARALAFIGKKLDLNTDIAVMQPNQEVKATLHNVGFLEQAAVVEQTPQAATA